MTDRAALKQRICAELDAAAKDIYAVADRVYQHPEFGFKEWETAGVVAERLAELGIPFRVGLALTGVKAMMEGARPGPTVAVLGELDAIGVPDHPGANKQTGAAHACGHHGQIAIMLGVGLALQATHALESLAGSVTLMAVPAEEYVEVEYRMGLRDEGKIELLGGKPELIRLGEFDDVDIAMMVHLSSAPQYGLLHLADSNNGVLVKQMRFQGRAAHAGSAPDRGINALNAANIAIHAIHAQRETFRDQDSIRVHPIITQGGSVVSVVPADVRMETFVRGKTLEAIEEADHKVDRALRAGALAVGAQVTISTLAGYLPIKSDPALAEVFAQNAITLVGPDNFKTGGHRGGSTDMGDVSHILPALHPYANGATGTGHGADFLIQDYEAAILTPAKAMALTIVDLLWEDGQTARRIAEGARNRLMTKDEYLALMRRLNRVETYQE
ncbi:MAG TPA: amidohydrolase [Dehalococcoidia bacterium]|nr:amidohydrolase [Dehalococcoidia bacterium]